MKALYDRLVNGNSYWSYILLLIVQCVVILVLLHQYLFGNNLYAFHDIGADSITMYLPHYLYLAEQLYSGNWPTGWSFSSGLGGDIGSSNPLDYFMWIQIALGQDYVIHVRLWLYIAKLILGAAVFYLLMINCGMLRQTAVIVSLCYAFSGAVMVDGQWDNFASVYILYPLVLLGVRHYFIRRSLVVIPVTLLIAIAGGMLFPFSIGLLLVYALFASLVYADAMERRAVFSGWMLGVFPLALIGLLLSAPLILPFLAKMLDSARAGGDHSIVAMLLADSYLIDDSDVLISQLASFFHKNMLGIANNYTGWTNYLEGASFYVGILPIFLAGQLYAGGARERRVLAAGLLFLLLFILFPGFRYLAYAFAVPYFRDNNIWIAILLLYLSAYGLNLVFRNGVHVGSAAVTALLLSMVFLVVNLFHQAGVMAYYFWLSISMIFLVFLVFVYSWYARPDNSSLFYAFVIIVACSSILFNYHSFNVDRKVIPKGSGVAMIHSNEIALGIDALKEFDKSPFYRIEKTFETLNYNDSLFEGYYGVPSYAFHSASTVRIFRELGLIVRDSSKIPLDEKHTESLAYTNWLPGFGDRVALHTLVGVKYVLSRDELNWPAFTLMGGNSRYMVYLNQLAMPLGFVYQDQVLASDVQGVFPASIDILMLQAAITDTPAGAVPVKSVKEDGFDLGTLNLKHVLPLRERGLQIEHFEREHIKGHIENTLEGEGILFFSIPFHRGWKVMIDGEEVEKFVVNFGFTGVLVRPGKHDVELVYAAPWRGHGMLLMLGALLLLGYMKWRQRSTKLCRDPVSS